MFTINALVTLMKYIISLLGVGEEKKACSLCYRADLKCISCHLGCPRLTVQYLPIF